jgi:predicted  nucleic acid-binding Zn-ribbon protein
LLDQLKCLIQFQILEDKKARLIRGYEESPRRFAEIEKEFEQFEAEYLAKKAECDHAKKMHRSLEQAIADLETKISRSKQRMSEVKTNKEYQAIIKEIEDLKKEISGKEDGTLEFMERIESLGKELKGLEGDLEKRRKKLEEDKKTLEAENELLKERLDRLEALQQKVRDKMEPDILKRSEFLMIKQAGIAVAAVENGVCQVCHLNIPPQKFIELQRDEALHQCPHCHRYIYWPGHEGYCVVDEDLDEN